MRGSALVIVLAVIVGLVLLAGGYWMLQQWKTTKDDAVQTWQKISDDARKGIDMPPATQPTSVPGGAGETPRP